ncbi:hypothetical protein LX70_00579 [Defluviimonas denitrificans]|jgi:hypothetical protein|uniref:Uncharacterized protein n=1 Tax=Albidovulum denitrificans TaxID=404881 RepID=A0A2S8SD83_9RHOB|nr:hypothetical protein [Defluviimonas denitrificans]PQV58766.1 hypothetical protein LX70_00579 [Defluviimonas denitrificans]
MKIAACILIISATTGDCVKERDGRCKCVSPNEIAALEKEPDIWDRLKAAVAAEKAGRK